MKRAILILMFVAFCLSVWAQCPTNYSAFRFDTQSELNAFAINYPNCTELPYLRIYMEGIDEEDPPIYNLSPLDQVTSIAGDLSVEYIGIDDFSGLDNLETIGGDFIVDELYLTSLNGLESLTSVGGDLFPRRFGIGTNPIPSLSGLENLTYVGGDFNTWRTVSLASLSSLTTIGGDFWIWETTATTLNGLENLTSVGGELEISYCGWLADISALANLNSIGSVKILTNGNLAVCDIPSICNYIATGGTHYIGYNAPGCESSEQVEAACLCSSGNVVCPPCPTGDLTLTTQQEIDDFANTPNCTSVPGKLIIRGDTPTSITNLNGLSQLTSTGNGLLIDGNAITNLNGLHNLTTTGYNLVITNNPNLTSLAGLENITSTASHLKIENNDLLIDLTGLNGITSVGESVLILGNAALQDLSGLENLTDIGSHLYIQNNPALTDLSGLENLGSTGGDIRIQNNEVLDEILALSNTTTMGGEIVIIGNNNLTSLDGLENIAPNSMTNLVVINNPNLTICNQESICSYLQNGDTTNITNNASGCNTQAEIEVDCALCSLLPPIMDINTQPIPDGIYRAADEVNSTGTIPIGGDVKFKAGQTILLDGDFKVETNADFSAEIESCSGQ